MDDKIFSNDQDKLNWMYKTPSATIDREEYLLGRPVDKSFELALKEERQGANTDTNQNTKNYVDHECVPPSIRDLKNSQLPGVQQVDLSSKLKDDPLTLIRKQQTELKRKLIESQLKMAKTNDAVRVKSEPIARNESVARSMVRSKSDDLDDLLFENFFPIRKLIRKRDLEVSKKKPKKRSSSSSSDSSDDSSARNRLKKPQLNSGKAGKRAETGKPSKLSDEERKRKLQEMVSNADWREQDIRKKAAEANKRSQDNKPSTRDSHEESKNSFLSKTFMNVANSSTIENQIKSKIQFNQKSKSSMNSSFCRK